MRLNKRDTQASGFTLIEMLLVMVIIAAIIIMGAGYLQQRTEQLRIDRASSQMQQILNAGLSYYVSNGAWPADLACLQGSGSQLCTVSYLPPNLQNPWGSPYFVASAATSPSPLLYVSTSIPSQKAFGIASTLAGRLPLSYTTDADAGGIPENNNNCRPTSTKCTVVASVNIPGQNLNNARSVNFSGVYHNGACVPVPSCPVDANGTTMTPTIIVVPLTVSGIYDAPTTNSTDCSPTNQSGCQTTVVPISSFAAYATPMASRPLSCAAGGGTQQAADCNTDYQGTPLTGNFWRVCLSTTTEKGIVKPTNNTWGQLQGTIMAITRCVPNNEPAGSGFTVWSGS